MFERRAYRRKSGAGTATVLLALSAAGLLFLMLRPGADQQQPQVAATPVAAPAEAGIGADAAQSPAEPKELSGLRQQVEQASRDLTALRSAAAEMRTELGGLRKQREAMARAPEAGQPAALSASGAPEATPIQPSSSAPTPAATSPAATSPAAATPAAATPAANEQANAPPAPAAAADHPAPAEPARAAAPGAREAPPAPKPVRHAHNAHGYLLSARDQLQSGNVSAAEDALERAETWALNSSGAYRRGVDPTDDTLVGAIRRARADLRAGRSAAALRMLNGMLPKPAANRHAERANRRAER